ncbi:Mbov_0400 family ICE element protein [[Mycoplasma] anseris]|uniref:Uncharacterized protein n=1 Tax=[Mycoplasma] anseris TaxID=92400 RepID=A0A2Z4NCX6_9BACT|nr:hypothetical protein [[Mycoplasma] anseris]AWX69423.1 hypothetical protein DP065_01480 [[Mycoplasma] anseris]
MINGTIWKQRNINKSYATIGRNKSHEIFKTNIFKINRPYIIFVSNDKVYYLAAKSVKEGNYKETKKDKTNILVPQGIYGDGHFSAINTRAINVMEKELFFSLFEIDKTNNGILLNQGVYNAIMKQVLENIKNKDFNIFEIESISYSKATWYSKTEAFQRNYHFLEHSLEIFNSLDENQKISAYNQDNYFDVEYRKWINKQTKQEKEIEKTPEKQNEMPKEKDLELEL